MKKPLPTDLQILDAIYERYYDAFASEAFGVGTQQREILIPIDIPAIAKELRVDPDVVFGRLYYHFDHKFRYRRALTRRQTAAWLCFFRRNESFTNRAISSTSRTWRQC